MGQRADEFGLRCHPFRRSSRLYAWDAERVPNREGNVMNTQLATPARKRSKRVAIAAFGVAAVVGAASIVASSGPASGNGWDATAVLRDTNGDRVGKIRFEGDRNGTAVKVKVHGVNVGLDTFHGLHIHANDGAEPCNAAAPSGPFTNVGGHWNPGGTVHGGHAGDLPSLLVQADGTGSARSDTGRFDPAELAGRAVIMHAGPDNFANIPSRYVSGEPPVPGPDTATNGAGDAGGRIACGIVTLG